MRLSEKTFEINFPAQVNAVVGRRLIWFGLTQRQERLWGFDACTRIAGRLLVFQFKTSNRTVRGSKRFLVDHNQVEHVLSLMPRSRRSVFYVFPMIGTTADLRRAGGDVLAYTWLLDVHQLARIGQPIRKCSLAW